MTHERNQRAHDLVEAALARSPDERGAFLASACDDEQLRREVDSLLALRVRAGSEPTVQTADDLTVDRPGEPLAGQTLGRYQLRELLGAGGMGEVYRARDTRLDRDVAVKIVPEHLADDPDAIRRFEREAKAVAALSHPNILAIHDFGVERDVIYAVMELLEGETLRACLARSAPGWRQAVETGVAVADGLAAAHAKRIVHRDIKPENVFLTRDGQTKILDFGIARVQHPVTAASDAPTGTAGLTRPGAVLGTLAYMSPEQVKGEEADAASDIFSLGCVLYEMLTGKRPFARPTAAETVAAILKEDPPWPTATDPDVPAALWHVAQRCLQKNPAARFQTARDVALALRAVASGSQVVASAPVRRPLYRRPAAWLSVIAASLAVVIGVRFLSAGHGQVIDSLAILPLVNASGNAEGEILSDGLTESLINNLSQLPKLRVMARSTVFTYKDKEIDPRQVGHELNVRAVFMGRVTQHGDMLQIGTELVRVADGARLWGELRERKLTDVIAVQPEIAQQISEKLRLALTGEERRRLIKHHTENPAAYRLYLQGRYHWGKDVKEELEKAIECYKQATDLDPDYALAWVGIADAYLHLSSTYVSPSVAMPRSRAAAQKALELDESLAEAHAALAEVKGFYDWQFEASERDFKRAIELNPGYALAHNGYGNLLLRMRRFEAAQAEMDRALELDPLSPYHQVGAVWPVLFARHYDQAREQLLKIIDLEPDFPNSYLNLAWIYIWTEKPAEAFAPLEKARSHDNFWAIDAAQGYAYARAGQRAKAREVLADLQSRAKQELVSEYGFAMVYTALGENDAAFAALDRAYEGRDALVLMLNIDPFFDGLRSDPRFNALLRKTNLTP